MIEFGFFSSLKQGGMVKRVYGDVEKWVRTGTEGSNAFVNVIAEVAGKKEKERTMFIKDIDAEYWRKYPEGRPDHVLRKYEWLKEHGFPVVPELEIDEKNTSILMTDMTQGGRVEIVDKHHPLSVFPIEIFNRSQIVEAIPVLAKEAFARGTGVFLDSDSYAVYVGEDRNGQLSILDLGQMSYKLGESDTPYKTEEGAIAQAHYFIKNYFT